MFVYNHASGLYRIELKSKSSRFESSPRKEKSSFSPFERDSVTGDTIQTLDPLVPGYKRGRNTFGGKNGWDPLQLCRRRVCIHHMRYTYIRYLYHSENVIPLLLQTKVCLPLPNVPKLVTKHSTEVHFEVKRMSTTSILFSKCLHTSYWVDKRCLYYSGIVLVLILQEIVCWLLKNDKEIHSSTENAK